jgi:uncharacterized protein YfbU (UPF0304 family)
MDMWMFLEESFAKLSPTDLAKLARKAAPFGEIVRFAGFDGNNERHYGIATYLVDDMKRFQHFKGRDLNSHSQSVPGDKRMYRTFEPIRATLHSRGLNVDEMIAILKERLHPEYRGG